jgi:hypothetical protein
VTPGLIGASIGFRPLPFHTLAFQDAYRRPCEERKRRSNPDLLLLSHGLLRAEDPID